MTPQERFFHKVKRGAMKDDCWLWTGAVGSGRYGTFYFERRVQLAHRVSYQLHCGEIPPDLNVLHKCDNCLCVNPNHLFLGTQYENVQDMAVKGRANFGDRARSLGSKNGGAILNEEKAVKIKQYLRRGDTQREIAEEFGVSRSTIQAIAVGKLWSHV